MSLEHFQFENELVFADKLDLFFVKLHKKYKVGGRLLRELPGTKELCKISYIVFFSSFGG